MSYARGMSVRSCRDGNEEEWVHTPLITKIPPGGGAAPTQLVGVSGGGTVGAALLGTFGAAKVPPARQRNSPRDENTVIVPGENHMNCFINPPTSVIPVSSTAVVVLPCRGTSRS